MNKLDFYISRNFFNTLIFALVAFSLIFVIVDLVEFLDKFIDKQVPRITILTYYIYYLPYILVLVVPIAVLLASLFSIGQLARYNELTAMQTSGISLYRIALPLLISGFIISLLMILFGESVVPIASQRKFAIKREYLDQVPQQIFTKQSNINILQSENERINIGYFDSETNIAHDVTVQRYSSGVLLSRLDARKMIWQNNRWLLQDGISRQFQAGGEIARPFLQQEVNHFPFRPADLKKAQKQPDEMNYSELRQFITQIIHNGANPQRWLVELHLKIAFPFTNFIIVLFGIPLASLQKRSGAALGFGISLAICFLFFGLVKTFQAIGYNGMFAPWFAAWASNFIIGGIGIILLINVKK